MTALSLLAGRRGVLWQEIFSPQHLGNETLLLSNGREMKGLTLQVLGPQVPSPRDEQSWLGSFLQKAGQEHLQRCDTQFSMQLLFLFFFFVFYTCFSTYTDFSSLLTFLWPLCPPCVSSISAVNSYFLRKSV